VAMKAYGVSTANQLRVMRYTLVSFLRSPKRFLFPPKDDGVTAPEAGSSGHSSA